MKTVFIKINNISEINTSKISVHDLNNRYIDKEGKMYGLKYNRKTRKVSIIRIIRTPLKSAEYFDQILKSQRKEAKLNYTPNTEREPVKENPPAVQQESPNFNPDLFINESIELMTTHKQRIAGIMMNIKNSRVISERDRNDSTQMNDLFRNLEIDGIQRIDKALTNFKEMKNYPRSITYYISKLDSKGRKIVEELDTDSRKMAYIFASEMYYTVKTLYRTLLKILNDFNNFFDKINPEEQRDITGVERQFFTDAKTSIGNTIAEIESLNGKIKMYEDYLDDSENF